MRRAKRRYVEEGLEEVLRRHNSPNPYRKVDDKIEAHLTALACSPAPDGPKITGRCGRWRRRRWSWDRWNHCPTRRCGCT